jgi:DNA-binding MarR family transcriptional regulator
MASEDIRYSALEREHTLMMRRGRAMGRELAEQVHPDLDLATYLTLAQIADTAPTRASDLVDHFEIDKAVVSRQIRHLERLGLIERTADPRDGRAFAVRLTRGGASRLRQVQRTRNARFRKLLEAWPQRDVDELARLLARLNRQL